MTAASHCEAKLHAFRRTQDGVVVSFVIHPQEVPQALALDPLGTRYMLALAAIGDDEQPLPASPGTGARGEDRSVGRPMNPEAKARYRSASPGEQAVIRASLLPKDPQFRAWLSEKHRVYTETEGDAAEYIRTVCNVMSRREIATDPQALNAFLAMETAFKIDTNQMAEPR